LSLVYTANVALGVISKQVNESISKNMLIDVTFYLSHGNRKVTVLLDNDTDETLIS
jgi:hypothetical protein